MGAPFTRRTAVLPAGEQGLRKNGGMGGRKEKDTVREAAGKEDSMWLSPQAPGPSPAHLSQLAGTGDRAQGTGWPGRVSVPLR